MANLNLDPGFAGGPAARQVIKNLTKQRPIDPGFAGGPAARQVVKNLTKQRPIDPGFADPGNRVLGKTLKPTAEKPTAPAVPKAPTNPYGLDPRVAPYVQPQLDAIAAQRQQQQDALTAFTKAILGQLQGMTPAITNDYNQAIDQSRSLAQAGSDSLAKANGNDAIQSILSSAGAPDSQRVNVATNLNNVFNGGAAALFGAQGVAPGQQLIGDKAASLAFANELPGINALAGTNAIKNLLAQSGLAEQKVLAQVPSLMSQLNKVDIFGSGTGGYYTRDASGNVKKIVSGTGSTVAPKIFGSSTSGYYQIDPKTGKLTQLTEGSGPAPKIFGSAKTGYFILNADGSKKKLTEPVAGSSGSTHLQSKNVNGHVLTFDPSTGTYFIPGTTTAVDPNQFKKAPKVSTSDMRAARSFLFSNKNGYWADPNDPTTVLSASQANAIRNRGGTVVYTNVPPKGHDQDIQRIYETLVKKYGIPAQQAFNMVANQYRVWGAHNRANYFPKAGAAQDAAEPAAYSKFAIVAPGADRPGASTSPAVVDFVGKIGSLYGKKIRITTGTNHNEYVINTNRVSDHWTGNAADVAMSGPALTRLGQDALIAAGADPAWAKKQKGGLYNIGNYQIIFNSMEGGNHFNHLHVGVRGSTA